MKKRQILVGFAAETDDHVAAARKKLVGKNLDFIVLAQGGGRLLVDVKGRRFPGGPEGHERWVWECWSTEEDISGLQLESNTLEFPKAHAFGLIEAETNF